MAVTLEVTNEEITAYLSGEIDHHSAVELRRRIDEAVGRNTGMADPGFFRCHLYG